MWSLSAELVHAALYHSKFEVSYVDSADPCQLWISQCAHLRKLPISNGIKPPRQANDQSAGVQNFWRIIRVRVYVSNWADCESISSHSVVVSEKGCLHVNAPPAVCLQKGSRAMVTPCCPFCTLVFGLQLVVRSGRGSNNMQVAFALNWPAIVSGCVFPSAIHPHRPATIITIITITITLALPSSWLVAILPSYIP